MRAFLCLLLVLGAAGINVDKHHHRHRHHHHSRNARFRGVTGKTGKTLFEKLKQDFPGGQYTDANAIEFSASGIQCVQAMQAVAGKPVLGSEAIACESDGYGEDWLKGFAETAMRAEIRLDAFNTEFKKAMAEFNQLPDGSPPVEFPSGKSYNIHLGKTETNVPKTSTWATDTFVAETAAKEFALTVAKSFSYAVEKAIKAQTAPDNPCFEPLLRTADSPAAEPPVAAAAAEEGGEGPSSPSSSSSSSSGVASVVDTMLREASAKETPDYYDTLPAREGDTAPPYQYTLAENFLAGFEAPALESIKTALTPKEQATVELVAWLPKTLGGANGFVTMAADTQVYVLSVALGLESYVVVVGSKSAGANGGDGGEGAAVTATALYAASAAKFGWHRTMSSMEMNFNHHPAPWTQDAWPFKPLFATPYGAAPLVAPAVVPPARNDWVLGGNCQTGGNNAVVLTATPAAMVGAPPVLAPVTCPNPGGAGCRLDLGQPNNVNLGDLVLRQAAINAFDFVNAMHDNLYAFGFREDTSNFQINNPAGSGGAGGDPVIVTVIPAPVAGGGHTLPQADGTPTRINMGTSVTGHTALDSSFFAHEYFHAVFFRRQGIAVIHYPLLSWQCGGIHEGIADAMSMFATDSVAFGVAASGNRNSGFRSAGYSRTIITPPPMAGVAPAGNAPALTLPAGYAAAQANVRTVQWMSALAPLAAPNFYAFGEIIAQILVQTVYDWKPILGESAKASRSLMTHVLLDAIARAGPLVMNGPRLRVCMFTSLLRTGQSWLAAPAVVPEYAGMPAPSMIVLAQLWNAMDVAFSSRGLGIRARTGNNNYNGYNAVASGVAGSTHSYLVTPIPVPGAAAAAILASAAAALAQVVTPAGLFIC